MEQKSGWRISVAGKREAVMAAVDPWEKAAECVRGVATANAEQRPILEKLRDCWIALGNERSLMPPDQVAREIAAISRIHAEILSTERPALMHPRSWSEARLLRNLSPERPRQVGTQGDASAFACQTVVEAPFSKSPVQRGIPEAPPSHPGGALPQFSAQSAD
jgi:hypothetical protein